MNGEIKFRAWDKNKNRWFTNYDTVYIEDDGSVYSSYPGTEGEVLTRIDVDIQQFTGLKDKNGKEIYKGDIVRAMLDFGPGGYSERIVSIQWVNPIEWYQFNYLKEDTIEIIGNIYENPELLK
jgi:uncharacterized phage protein (TIGR01671 family)